MRTLRLVLATVALLAVSVGCAPQLDRIELGVQENRDEVAALEVENRRLAQEVKALAELLRLEFASGDESSAQRFAKLGQVSLRLDQLMQKLDDNAAYMRELSARVDLLAQRSGVPTLGEYRPPSGGEQAGMAELPEEALSIFQAAELDRSRGNVEMAREGFREFLERFPDSEKADDARYWLADLAYGDQEWQAAADGFAALLEDHPETDWAAAAMYKRGLSLQELGQDELAELTLRELMAKYPESNEAQLVELPGG
ncbi:tol-pal system protein YbgF [bacterium]|nr:tol-pal system protein YbgF [bacterium]